MTDVTPPEFYDTLRAVLRASDDRWEAQLQSVLTHHTRDLLELTRLYHFLNLQLERSGAGRRQNRLKKASLMIKQRLREATKGSVGIWRTSSRTRGVLRGALLASEDDWRRWLTPLLMRSADGLIELTRTRAFLCHYLDEAKAEHRGRLEKILDLVNLHLHDTIEAGVDLEAVEDALVDLQAQRHEIQERVDLHRELLQLAEDPEEASEDLEFEPPERGGGSGSTAS